MNRRPLNHIGRESTRIEAPFRFDLLFTAILAVWSIVVAGGLALVAVLILAVLHVLGASS